MTKQRDTPQPPPPPSGYLPTEHPQGTRWQEPAPGTQGHGWGHHPPAPPAPAPSEPPSRSWFRRHKIMTGLLVLVVLIVLVNIGSGGGQAPAPAGGQAPRAEAPAEGTAAEDEVAEEAAEEPAAPGPGTPVRDGSFEFVVTEVETGLESVGEGFSVEEAQGQFVMVHLSVTNIGDRAQTMFDSNQVLVDDQGREHQTSSAAMWLDNDLFLEDINPGNSVEGFLLYDVPADAVPVSVELHDSVFSGGVTVTLR